jgi:hypothetical protein
VLTARPRRGWEYELITDSAATGERDNLMTASSQRPLTRREQDEQSLDFVQRMVISGLVAISLGSVPVVLAAYLAIRGEIDLPPSSVRGMWVMSGITGSIVAAVILLINRRRPYSPWIVVGLLPMAISWFWIPFDQ